MADRSRFSTWRLEPLTFTSWAISITVRPLEVWASGSAPFCNNMRTVSSSPSTTATWIGDSNSVRGKALHALQWISPAALRSFIAEKLNFVRKFWTCFSFTCSNMQAAVWPCTISSSVRLLKTDSTPAANMAVWCTDAAKKMLQGSFEAKCPQYPKWRETSTSEGHTEKGLWRLAMYSSSSSFFAFFYLLTIVIVIK